MPMFVWCPGGLSATKVILPWEEQILLLLKCPFKKKLRFFSSPLSSSSCIAELTDIYLFIYLFFFFVYLLVFSFYLYLTLSMFCFLCVVAPLKFGNGSCQRNCMKLVFKDWEGLDHSFFIFFFFFFFFFFFSSVGNRLSKGWRWRLIGHWPTPILCIW